MVQYSSLAPLSELMMGNLRTHTCVTLPQWVKKKFVSVISEIERVRIVSMGNGSTKYLNQLKRCSRSVNKNKTTLLVMYINNFYQYIFSRWYGLRSRVLLVKLLSCECNRIPLMISQRWFRYAARRYLNHCWLRYAVIAINIPSFIHVVTNNETSCYCMMTSSNGIIFRVTGPLCGEFTGPGEFPAQMSVTRSFDVFFDLRLNKRLSKQPWGWWFETPAWSLWHQRNGYVIYAQQCFN